MRLILRAGQAGRLIVTRAEGTPASAAPIGAVEVKHVGPVAMETDSATGDLLVRPMLPGIHPFEIRLAGRTIAAGYFEVLPSPLDGVLGEQSWEIQAAAAPALASIVINWPKGEPGEDGAPIQAGTGLTQNGSTISFFWRVSYSGFEFTEDGRVYINCGDATHPPTGTTLGVGLDTSGKLCVPELPADKVKMLMDNIDALIALLGN